MIESLLKTLAEELEMEEVPKKLEDGSYKVPIHEEMAVSVRELDPGVAFFSPIGPCPKERREELFILLMKANFLGQGTGGGTIALDGNENFLTLSSVLPYDMNYKTFKDALEDFTNYLDYWKEELIRHKNAAETI
ncbi:MAG: type III secretion system chaperone [Verrucomicrobia bacterium]|nr:type III secretion system chaperone [Verrucomicrobiota bacterium]